jgi:hypothetical protein
LSRTRAQSPAAEEGAAPALLGAATVPLIIMALCVFVTAFYYRHLLVAFETSSTKGNAERDLVAAGGVAKLTRNELTSVSPL